MRRPRSISEGRVARFPLARDFPTFLRTFQDGYFRWSRFAFWRATGGFSGITLWGHLTEEDGRELRSAIEALLDSNPQDRWPHRMSLLDASEVVAVDPRAFEIMAEHFATQGARKQRPVRQAMIRPRGYTGSIVAGFFNVTRPPFETGVFATVGEAMDWLGATDEHLVADLEQLRHALSHEATEVAALRRVLDASLFSLTLSGAARQLGLSPRTLQRRLGDAGTSFHTERSEAQVRAAQLLLSQTEDKIASIARAVGCSSAPQFSALFRKHTGLTPSAYRRQARSTTMAPSTPASARR